MKPGLERPWGLINRTRCGIFNMQQDRFQCTAGMDDRQMPVCARVPVWSRCNAGLPIENSFWRC